MRLILILSLLSRLSAESVLGVDYHQPDKREHFKFGAAVAMASILFDEMVREPTPLERLLVGIGAATVAGISKEIIDKRDPANHTAEIDDAVATGGLVVGLVFCWEF